MPPMKKYKNLHCAFLLTLLCGGNLYANDQLAVHDLYVTAPIPGQVAVAAYMSIQNNGDTPVTLVGATSPASVGVQIHNTQMSDELMQMREVDSILIPAGGSAVMEPGGMHMMLVGIEREALSGPDVDLILVFADGSEMLVKAPLRSLMQQHHHH